VPRALSANASPQWLIARRATGFQVNSILAGSSEDESAPVPVRFDPFSADATEAEVDRLRLLAQGSVEEHSESAGADFFECPVGWTPDRGIQQRQSTSTASMV
jgi:hypothetical protein